MVYTCMVFTVVTNTNRQITSPSKPKEYSLRSFWQRTSTKDKKKNFKKILSLSGISEIASKLGWLVL